MISVLNKGNVPVYMWAPMHEVESVALDQLTNIANLPCVFKHVAVMPDVHMGKGATVGSVIATKNAIIPAAVGVDIGCGMMAAQLPMKVDDLAHLSQLRSTIEKHIPVGMNQHDHPYPHGWNGFKFFHMLPEEVQERRGKAEKQIGTLGGGNHFIEICKDTFGDVWIMLHSGSRNIGKEIAEVHIDKAKGIMREYFIKLPDPDLAYFAEGTQEFQHYFYDLQWAQEYAAMNRETMMKILLDIMRKHTSRYDLKPLALVNCHHNYAEREHHFGHNVIVTRKGAVQARVGDFGIIPGSMGDRSYIVRGKGNPESYNSCSHGAGRRMSRSKARATFNVADLEAQTEGIECRKDAAVIDEIPGAYKRIDQVMENQRDLVEVVAELSQLICVKG